MERQASNVSSLMNRPIVHDSNAIQLTLSKDDNLVGTVTWELCEIKSGKVTAQQLLKLRQHAQALLMAGDVQRNGFLLCMPLQSVDYRGLSFSLRPRWCALPLPKHSLPLSLRMQNRWRPVEPSVQCWQRENLSDGGALHTAGHIAQIAVSLITFDMLP